MIDTCISMESVWIVFTLNTDCTDGCHVDGVFHRKEDAIDCALEQISVFIEFDGSPEKIEEMRFHRDSLETGGEACAIDIWRVEEYDVT